MSGFKTRAFKTHPHVSLEHLPQNDFYRQLETRPGLSFVRQLVAETCAPFSRPCLYCVFTEKPKSILALSSRLRVRLMGERWHACPYSNGYLFCWGIYWA
jgi:hypothetical protein